MHDKLTTDAQNPMAKPSATASEIVGPMGAVAIGAPWDAQPFSIKRDSINIINCDAEPVRAPGCIQAHGALLVLRLSDFSILQASENTQAILGQDPTELLNICVAAVIKNEGEIRLRSILATESIDCNPIYAFTLPANGPIAALDVTLHTIDGGAVLEFEATGRSQSDTDSGHIAPNPCQQLDYYAIHLLSGLDRVMICKFHAHHHGEVFAESRRSDLAPWLGLHYPVADSPRQARELLAKTWIRPTPDVQGGLAELMPLLNPDSGKPLDMTFCMLRGLSLMHTEYLKNMGVSAGLTISLRRDDALWGLISCHHYSGPHHVPYDLRAACEFLGQVASMQLRAVEDRENAAYRLKLEDVNQQLLSMAAQEGGLVSVVDGKPSLLDAMHAAGAALFHLDRWWRIGQAPTEPQLEALGQWLMGRPDAGSQASPVFATHALAAEYPPAAAFADVASGLLAVPLSRSGKSLILWFRPEIKKTVNWSGDPQDKPQIAGPHGPRLTPRRSFELFSKSVHQQAEPWLAVEVEAASRLRVLIMELVIMRAERLAGLNADLARSNDELDAFAYVASHDLKEPLRGIHKYAYQLTHAVPASEDNKRKLDGLMRLTLRMDNLLDSLLHFSQVGREELTLEKVDLNHVLADAVEMVSSRTEDSHTQITRPRPLPFIMCDHVRVREVLVNLLSNALKYNDKPAKRVKVGFIHTHESALRQGFPDSTAGQTVYYVHDNGIGIAPRYFDQVFKMFKRLHGREEYGGGTGAGLTIVRKLVERHRGQVWLASTVGEGSTFFFTLSAADDSQHA